MLYFPLKNYVNSVNKFQNKNSLKFLTFGLCYVELLHFSHKTTVLHRYNAPTASIFQMNWSRVLVTCSSENVNSHVILPLIVSHVSFVLAGSKYWKNPHFTSPN